MKVKNKTIGIILAGGHSERLGSKVPKQFMSLNGKLLIQYTIDTFKESNLFDEIIIVANKKYHKLFPNLKCVKNGTSRNKSIYNGLLACPGDTDYVLFHDAARPFIKSEDLIKYIVALRTADSVVTCEKITDALYFADRDKFKLIQTPEAFNYKMLKSKFNPNSNLVAIYEHLMPNTPKLIELDYLNFKITYDRDFFIAEQLLKYYSPIKNKSCDIKNKNILIFGGTGGIGKALKSILIKKEANVDAIGSGDLNLSKPIKKFKFNKKYDCIIYSAGAYSVDDEGLINSYDKIMNVNYRNFIKLVEDAPLLLKKNGNIIAISSTAAAKGRPGIALYSASKSALNTFVEAIYPTLLKHNIKINVICPAKVDTPLQTKINPNADKASMIKPKALANIIINYIDTEKTGEIVYIRVGQE